MIPKLDPSGDPWNRGCLELGWGRGEEGSEGQRQLVR